MLHLHSQLKKLGLCFAYSVDVGARQLAVGDTGSGATMCEEQDPGLDPDNVYQSNCQALEGACDSHGQDDIKRPGSD